MKKTSIILLIGSILFGATFTSCEDMLSPESSRHRYEIAQDTLYSYWGIIKSLQNVAERYIVLGECRGELVDGSEYVSDSIRAILDFDMDNAMLADGNCRFLNARDYYHIVNSCNAYLAHCDTLRKTGTLQPYMLKEWAQVVAIRAWVYLQLVQVYGEVPYYTEPLLTTNDIEAFMISPDKINIDRIADMLSPELEKALQIELLYGLPQYEDYESMCHSTKVMIPLNLILGDIYLTKGDKESCTKAAQYYYDYLSNTQGHGHMVPGGPLPAYNYCYGYKGEGMERPIYNYISESLDGATYTPWTESGAVNKNLEAITVIPSSTNKLWGTVLRGVNELYGYASEISVRTEETSDTTSATFASVILSPQYDVKQLAASQTYFDLCKEQTYEVYIGASNATATELKFTPDTVVGDARRYWVKDIMQEYDDGMTNTDKFITKLNPHGFSTVSHVIYRKSMVWLRFAEALNRAGYPSYAFAILKNGLCNNDKWYPELEEFAVKDSLWCHITPAGDTIPENYKDGIYTTQAALMEYVQGLIDADEYPYDENGNIGVNRWKPTSYENYPDEDCQKILYYLDRREVEASPSFLNFSFDVLKGNISSNEIITRSTLTERGCNIRSTSFEGDPRTVGVHTHGCGTPIESHNKLSVYNYVDCVAKKGEQYNQKYGLPDGYVLTKEDIYSGDFDDVVQDCVEDLIVDEEAMELAFEGTRFFDLMRVAHRRNDPSYLANRVARRDAALKTKLLDTRNWYFRLK